VVAVNNAAIFFPIDYNITAGFFIEVVSAIKKNSYVVEWSLDGAVLDFGLWVPYNLKSICSVK